MPSWNGIGTHYYGWSHDANGTSEATEWFVLFFVPIFPVARHRLVMLSDPNDPASASFTSVPGVYTSYELRDEYRILDTSLPFEPANIVWTYLFTYLAMPLVILAPLAFLVPYGRFALAEDQRSDLHTSVAVIAWTTYGIFWACGWPAYMLHLSRGARPSAGQTFSDKTVPPSAQ